MSRSLFLLQPADDTITPTQFPPPAASGGFRRLPIRRCSVTAARPSARHAPAPHPYHRRVARRSASPWRNPADAFRPSPASGESSDPANPTPRPMQQEALVLRADRQQGAGLLGGPVLHVSQYDHRPLPRRQTLHRFLHMIPELASGDDPLRVQLVPPARRLEPVPIRLEFR